MATLAQDVIRIGKEAYNQTVLVSLVGIPPEVPSTREKEFLRWWNDTRGEHNEEWVQVLESRAEWAAGKAPFVSAKEIAIGLLQSFIKIHFKRQMFIAAQLEAFRNQFGKQNPREFEKYYEKQKSILSESAAQLCMAEGAVWPWVRDARVAVSYEGRIHCQGDVMVR
jgi:hypothetical protein